jgi:hypothetical protein
MIKSQTADDIVLLKCFELTQIDGAIGKQSKRNDACSGFRAIGAVVAHGESPWVLSNYFE